MSSLFSASQCVFFFDQCGAGGFSIAPRESDGCFRTTLPPNLPPPSSCSFYGHSGSRLAKGEELFWFHTFPIGLVTIVLSDPYYMTPPLPDMRSTLNGTAVGVESSQHSAGEGMAAFSVSVHAGFL